MTLPTPIAGLIDKQEEITRLEKEHQRLRADLERSQTKLSNPNFADKAPAAVVEIERLREQELCDAFSKLDAQSERIRKL